MKSYYSLPSQQWVVTACFLLAGSVVTASALMFDDRLLNDVALWSKPLKFYISVAVHFITLTLLARLISVEQQKGMLMRCVISMSILAGLFETLYISLQAARGRASHFNYSTPWEGALYTSMGVGAVMLVLASLTVGILIARNNAIPWSGLKTGAVIGLSLGSLFTLLIAGFMSSQPSHYVGMANVSDASGLPILGWSMSLPDMRPAHFFATHMMQILPLAGLLADRLVPPHAGRYTIALAALLTALIAALCYMATMN